MDVNNDATAEPRIGQDRVKPSQLSYLVTILNSKMKAQEFLLLIMQKKPAIRQGFYDAEFEIVRELCDALSIRYAKSKFAVRLTENHFSNKGLRLSAESEEDVEIKRKSKHKNELYFYYFSFDKDVVELLSQAEDKNLHVVVGQLLGYPPCCIDFFQKEFSDEKTDLQHRATRWETNLTKRKFDWCVLSHFPCHTECQSSIELAYQYYDTIFADNRIWAKELKENMKRFDE
jgi:hypothetical protein